MNKSASQTPNNLPANLIRWVALCFFVSGVAGLVYQVAWTRYLGLFLGHTSHAIVAVLAAFMGGLAIGNALLGRIADRVAKPLRIYAWLELAIALYAFLFPEYFVLLDHVYAQSTAGMEPGGTGSKLIKFAFALLSVTLPAALMGGTLPVLSRMLTRSLGEVRSRVSTLYFINSFGAVVGVVIGNFMLVPQLGLDLTIYLAGGMNVAAGLVALALPEAPVETTAKADTDKSVPPAQDDTNDAIQRLDMRLAVIGIGVSGFCAMLYEVAWTRLLALSVGSSADAYAIMLVAFISGIAIGAWLIGRLSEKQCGMNLFGWLELAVGGTTMVAMLFYDYVPYLFLQLTQMLAREDSNYLLYQLIQSGICLLVMIIPTICLGMTLPLVSRIATRRINETGRSVGIVFSVNTLGTVLGTIATGFLLMPKLGLATTFALGNACNVALGICVLHRNRWRNKRSATLPILLIASSVLVVYVGRVLDTSWQQVFSAGHWRWRGIPKSYGEFEFNVTEDRIPYYRDGAGSSVAIRISDWAGGGTNVTLRVNGKPDASTDADMATQVLSAQIPSLLHPDPKKVLIVGLGSGVTAGSVLQHTGVEELTVVEMSPEVIEAGRFFAHANHDVLSNPRMRLVYEDAKSFLRSNPDKYDIIISEPSNPWMAGIAGVFSLEFFEACRARLRPGGIMVQWYHRYEASNAGFETVLQTFTSVYPVASIWEGLLNDSILLGVAGDELPDFKVADIISRMGAPKIRSDLGRIGISRPAVFFSLQVVDFRDARMIPQLNTPIHSDYFPILEGLEQRGFFVRRESKLIDHFDQRREPRGHSLFRDYVSNYEFGVDDIRAILGYDSKITMLSEELRSSLIAKWKNTATQDPGWAVRSFISKDPVAEDREACRNLDSFVGGGLNFQDQRHHRVLSDYAKRRMKIYRTDASVFNLPDTDKLGQLFLDLSRSDVRNRRVYLAYLAELAWDRGQGDQAYQLGADAFGPAPAGAPDDSFALDWSAAKRALAIMIRHHRESGRTAEASALAQQAIGMEHVDLEHRIIDDIVLETEVRKTMDAMSSATQQTSATPQP